MNLLDLLSEYKSEIASFFSGAIIATIIVVFVIERNNLRWFVKEMVKLYSGEPSFFSKKRVDSGIAYAFAFWMTVFYLKNRINDMDIWSFGYVLTAWLFIAGYNISKIQAEKKMNLNDGNSNSQEAK